VRNAARKWGSEKNDWSNVSWDGCGCGSSTSIASGLDWETAEGCVCSIFGLNVVNAVGGRCFISLFRDSSDSEDQVSILNTSYTSL
jgi:hypothetical protein